MYIHTGGTHKVTIIYCSDICMHQNGTIPKQTTKTTNNSTLCFVGNGYCNIHTAYIIVICVQKTLCIFYVHENRLRRPLSEKYKH